MSSVKSSSYDEYKFQLVVNIYYGVILINL